MSLQDYIYEHIPIIRDNRFEIVEGQELVVGGRYADHINHRNSVFGGSLSTALILVSWASFRRWLAGAGYADAIIVIQSQQVQFLEPVTRDFCAKAHELVPKEKSRLLAMLTRFGKARTTMVSWVTHTDDSEILAEFSGEFVVQKRTPTST